jgi:hypothetical protein
MRQGDFFLALVTNRLLLMATEMADPDFWYCHVQATAI